MANANISKSATRTDWWMTFLSSWMLGGLYLDGWAHRHISSLATFFTPWHGVLYSGFLATFAFLGIVAWRSHARGWPWLEAVPAGYGLSLVGVIVFLAGGLGDLVWHTIFGIEARLEALISPTHLLLAVGGMLIGAGPFRAAWRRPDGTSPPRFMALLPMLLSLTFGLSVLTFFTQFAHPFVHPTAEGQMPENTVGRQPVTEVAGILLQSALMTGIILLAVWRWSLPFGSVTLVLTLNALLMSALEMHFYFVMVGLVAGLAADFLLQWLKPSASRPTPFRLFAFLQPALFYATFFLAIALRTGTWWSVHMWTGAIALAGLVGWLLSYLLIRSGYTPQQG